MKDNDNKENTFDDHPNERIMRSLNKSKRQAIFTNGMFTSAFILMILPICALITVIYYGWGITESRGNELLEVVEKTIATTEPNLSVDVNHISNDLGLFSMTGTFDLYKQIGSSSMLTDTESYQMWLSEFEQPRKHRQQENYFIHPDEQQTLNKRKARKKLNELPEGTVAEIFVSLDSFYDENRIETLFDDFDVDLIWYAVSDGKTDKDRNLLGYPSKEGDIESSFNEKKDNQEQFIDVLNFLRNYEEQVQSISKRNLNSLNLNETIDFIEQNGTKIYGVVLTGPTNEFLELGELDEIRDYRLGEVELWNWD